jgi:hypothetical protein
MAFHQSLHQTAWRLPDLTTGWWKIAVEYVRGSLPSAADLPPNDDVLARIVMGLTSGRNRQSVGPAIKRHVSRLRNYDLLGSEGQIEAGRLQH